MLESCHYCKASLYADDEKLRDSKLVYCSDGEACSERLADRQARFRDVCEQERLTGGQRSRSYYI
jgi:hypothetical protein